MIYDLHFGKGFFSYKMTVVTTWNELNRKQLLQAAILLHSGYDTELALQKALQIVSGKSALRFLLLPKDFRERTEKYATWLLDGENTLTNQLLPKYKGLYGPDESFGNLLLVEFHYTETAYHRMVTEKDPDALDELIAIMYREPKANYDVRRNSDGDIRTPFAHGDIAYHKAKVKKWPNDVKLAIMLWYDGCRQQLVKDYEAVYPKAKTQTDNYFEGLYKMMRSLAGDKYGTIDKVELIGVHTAHLEITCMLEDAKAQEEHIKSLSNE